MYIKELTNKEFKDFITNYSLKSIYQTPEYGFVMNEEKYDAIFLGLIDNNKVLAATLILIEKKSNFKYAYAPKGFLIDYNNYDLLNKFTLEIKKYLISLNIVAVKINPLIIKKEDNNDNINFYNIFNNLEKLGYKHLGYNNYFESLKPRYETVLDLNMPYYIIFKNIRKEFRTKIRGSENMGIKIHKGNIDDLKYLYLHTKSKYPRELKYFQNLYTFFKEDAEFYYAKLDPIKYLKKASKDLTNQEIICNNLNNELQLNKSLLSKKMSNDIILYNCKNNLLNATKLVTDYPDGIILSSVFLIKNDNEINILMDGYNLGFKKFNSKHLLIWKIIEKYSNLGYKKINLGGIINPNIEDKKYKGLNEFKLSFGSKVIEYAGDFELIINKPLYFMYKNSIFNKK